MQGSVKPGLFFASFGFSSLSVLCTRGAVAFHLRPSLFNSLQIS
jgi:hypothetical protein